jgi:hypothetical protein
MTDRQKLLAALVSEPDDASAGLSVLEVAAMLERVRDRTREALPIAS